MVRSIHVAVGSVILAVLPQLQTPVFRSNTVLVPVDVRVIDRRTHKPVTDLRQDEFVVMENDVRQQIRLFSTQSLSADLAAESTPLVPTTSAPTSFAPQTRRTFLIVLGNGHLQTWSSVLDALQHFIKDRLLPQDYVAVMAFNRATDFTTDHERIAALVGRFRKGNEMVNAQLNLYRQAAGQFAGAYIPKDAQARIDAIFKGPDSDPTRTVPTGQISNADRLADDQRRIQETLRARERNAELNGVFLPPPLTAAEIPIAMSFDEYVAVSTQTSDDLAKLYSGVSYLRHLEGEKHMIFVTERGLMLPRVEDDDSLAALAADARVAIDIFHTGGAVADGGGRLPGDWRVTTSRSVAAETGGQFALTQQGKDFVDQLDAATRFSYLLGYYPSRTNWDGTYRKVNVRVIRSGPYDVEYRHGYAANLELKPIDRAKALAYTRVSAAANAPEAIADIVLMVTAANGAAGKESWVDVTVTMPPQQLGFSEKDGKKQTAVDVAIFCFDDKDHMLGQRWTSTDLALPAETLASAQTAGLRYSTRVTVTSPARVVKVVVYDHGADVAGSVVTKLDASRTKK